MKPNPPDGVVEPTNASIQLCRDYAIEQFQSAETNDVFVCGMRPFDADDLMHGVIVTREGLECHHPWSLTTIIIPRHHRHGLMEHCVPIVQDPPVPRDLLMST